MVLWSPRGNIVAAHEIKKRVMEDSDNGHDMDEDTP